MRPARFQAMLALAVDNDGKFTATTYAEAGITRSLYGLILTGHPLTADIQIAARSALGDAYARPEHIVTGPPCPPVPMPGEYGVRAGIERYLAALVTEKAADEISSVHLYTMRDKPQAIKHGATFVFHDGSAIFLYVHE